MNSFEKCIICGRMAYLNNSGACSMCAEKEIKQLLTTREYLAQQPEADMADVIRQLGVSETTLTHWIKEGKLEGYGHKLFVPCTSCGRPTREHRLCTVCRSTLQSIAKKITDDTTKGPRHSS